MNIPKRLKSTMAEKHISQSTLASELGVRQTTISNYLNGVNKPKKGTLIAIAKFLEVSEDWLRTGKGPKALPQEIPTNEKFSYINRKIKEIKTLTKQDLRYLTKEEQLKMLMVYVNSIVDECNQVINYIENRN